MSTTPFDNTRKTRMIDDVAPFSRMSGRRRFDALVCFQFLRLRRGRIFFIDDRRGWCVSSTLEYCYSLHPESSITFGWSIIAYSNSQQSLLVADISIRSPWTRSLALVLRPLLLHGLRPRRWGCFCFYRESPDFFPP